MTTELDPQAPSLRLPIAWRRVHLPPSWLTAAAVATGVLVAGAAVPGALVISWYVPVADMLTICALLMVAALAAADGTLRADGRALPLAAAATVIAALWVPHLITFPGVLPGDSPVFSPQASAMAFSVAHIATPLLLALSLLVRVGMLRRPRKAAALTLLGALAAGSLIAVAGLLLAPVLPATIAGNGFTGLNRILNAIAVPIMLGAVVLASRRRADPLISGATRVALAVLIVEAIGQVFVQQRYTGLWWALVALRPFPAIGLIAGQIGLSRASVIDERTRLREMGLLDGAARELAATLELNRILDTVAKVAAELASPPGETQRRAQVFEVACGVARIVGEFDDSGATVRGQSWPLSEHTGVAAVVASGTSLTATPDEIRPGPSVRATMKCLGVTASAWVPLCHDVEPALVLAISCRSGGRLSPALMERLEALASIAELAIANARAHARLADREEALEARNAELATIAASDALTGLPNRREFERLISTLPRIPFAILAIDIDGLKPLNDEFGHEAGDVLIQTVATTLSAVRRQGDVLARVGGDELSAILLDVDIDAATVVAERMRTSLHGAHMSRGRARVSIGCVAAPAGADAHAVWRAADGALYKAKRAGRDRVVSFAPHQETDRSVASDWSQILVEVLEHTQALTCVYQPIVQLVDRTVAGHEALARPATMGASDRVDELFKTAHRLGRTRDLDWVCRRAALADAVDVGLPLFIKVSSGALLDPLHDADQMLLLTRWTGWPASRLVLEITEREAIRDLDRLRTVVTSYRELGFRFAIDNVGESHSGIEVMTAAAPEFIKMAPSLVAAIEDTDVSAAIRAMVAFADASNAQVIVDGVNDLHTAALAATLGVGLGQGRALAAPVAGGGMRPETAEPGTGPLAPAAIMRRRADRDRLPTTGG